MHVFCLRCQGKRFLPEPCAGSISTREVVFQQGFVLLQFRGWEARWEVTIAQILQILPSALWEEGALSSRLQASMDEVMAMRKKQLVAWLSLESWPVEGSLPEFLDLKLFGKALICSGKTANSDFLGANAHSGSFSFASRQATNHTAILVLPVILARSLPDLHTSFIFHRIFTRPALRKVLCSSFTRSLARISATYPVENLLGGTP